MDGQDIQSHLDTMSKLWEGALAAGVAIPDDKFCHVLRSSFPSSWALFIATLVTIGDPIVLEASLLAFVDLRGQSSKLASSTSTTALMSSVVKCTNCGKDNHTFDRCYQKGGGAKNSAPHWWKTRQQSRPPHGNTPRAKVAATDIKPLSGIPSAPVQDITTFTATHAHLSRNPFRQQMNPFRQNPTDQTHYATHDTVNHATPDYHLFVASVGSRSDASCRVSTYADSGASHHYFMDRLDFETYTEISPVMGQGAGKDSTFQIIGVGSVRKDIVMDGRWQRVIFTNVVHAPDLTVNLISISQLDAEGVFVQVGNGAMVFINGSGVPFMCRTSTSGNLYELNLLPCTTSDLGEPPIATGGRGGITQ